MALKRPFFACVVTILTILLACGSAFAGWEPLAELKAPDPCEGAIFGMSVSLDSGTAVIGAPWRNNKQGAVHIFEVNQTDDWDYITTLLPPNLNDTDWFGYSVCVDANRIVVGTYYADEVYVFDYNGTEWSNEPEILAVAGSQDFFGFSVSIDGDTIVTGALGDIHSPGAAYVFDYNGVAWEYKQELTDSDGHDGDYFGRSVCIDGNVIVVGSQEQLWVGAGDPNYRRGSVSVFRQTAGTWSLEQKILDPNTDDLDHFGYSVSVSGDTFVAGAYEYDYASNGRAGAAFVYKWDGSSWVKNTTLTAPNAITNGRFGNSVAIDSDKIIVGNKYYSGGAQYTGAAFLFEWNGSSWSDGEIMEDPDGSENDYFGQSVAIDGDMFLTGAHREDQGQTDSGAAFIFLILIADLDRDGRVNFEDFAILADQWRQVPGIPSADIAPVPDGDGVVDWLDLKLLVEDWPKGP